MDLNILNPVAKINSWFKKDRPDQLMLGCSLYVEWEVKVVYNKNYTAFDFSSLVFLKISDKFLEKQMFYSACKDNVLPGDIFYIKR